MRVSASCGGACLERKACRPRTGKSGHTERTGFPLSCIVLGTSNLKPLYSRRESNPDRRFRKPLFYPLNYRSIRVSPCKVNALLSLKWHFGELILNWQPRRALLCGENAGKVGPADSRRSCRGETAQRGPGGHRETRAGAGRLQKAGMPGGCLRATKEMDAVRCVGGCGAVRWRMRCGALADAARCVGGCSAVRFLRDGG